MQLSDVAMVRIYHVELSALIFCARRGNLYI
jgi:hypothetical protein